MLLGRSIQVATEFHKVMKKMGKSVKFVKNRGNSYRRDLGAVRESESCLYQAEDIVKGLLKYY